MTQKQHLLFSLLFLTTLITFNAFCMRGEADYVRSPLHKAAWIGNIQEVMRLLERDPKPDKRDGDKNTPLHLAINAGHFDMVILLLEKQADHNAQNIDGNTPLHSAARWNRCEITKKLLEVGAKIQIKNIAGELPLDTAKSVKSYAVERLLDSAQPLEPMEEDTTMFFTIRSREAAAIRMMFEQARREEAIATQS